MTLRPHSPASYLLNKPAQAAAFAEKASIDGKSNRQPEHPLNMPGSSVQSVAFVPPPALPAAHQRCEPK